MSGIGVAGLLASACVVVGCLVMTAGVIGMLRMPDVYTKVHAAGKAVFLGLIAFCGAGLLAADAPGIRARVAVIAVFLLLTTPVASHVIVQAARAAGEPMVTPGALDEEREAAASDAR